MPIKRTILKQLISWKNQKTRKPLLLKGARQVGKTYSLKQFGTQHFPKTHYFNFEKQKELASFFELNLDPKRLIKELSFYVNSTIDISNDLVIFDEIQECPLALTSLKYFHEDMPQLALCAAGSLLGVYLTPTSFPVGKVEIRNMFPLSYDEFLLAIGEEQSYDILNEFTLNTKISDYMHQHLWECLKKYLVVGGLPEVVTTYMSHKENSYLAMETVRQRQEQLITMYNADMAKHSGKVNAMHIDRVWKSVPQQMGSTTDGSVSKYKFTGVLPGVSRYTRLVGPIDWLLNAGLIIKVQIVNSGQHPIAAYTTENMFKLYMFDVGILGALTNLSPKVLLDYHFGSYKGFIAENYIAQAFLYNHVKDLFCWQNGHAEVEFLKEMNGYVIPIEVKSGWVTRSKSLKTFAEKYHSPFRVIFSAHPLSIENEVHRYPLYLASHFPLEKN